MANRQTIPGINTNINKTLVSSQMQAANMQSPWRAPDIGGVIANATKVGMQYYEAEKDAAFKRLDLEATKMQAAELEEIRVADSNEAIGQIENNFKMRLNEAFAQDNWGKKWLKERSELFLAANSRDVMRAGIAKQHELYTLELDKTLNTWANDISTSAPDKARVLIGDANNYIDASNLLSPTEKQKTKDRFAELYLGRMASANPDVAIGLLKDEKFSGSLNIDAKEKIDSIVKKQFAEMKFQEQVKIFNNERELSEKLDDMPTDEALRFLEENEGNVSKKYFKAKETALLSAKGITAETRAATAQGILLDIATLDKNDEVSYLNGAQNILTRIEEDYARGEISLSDKKSLTAQIYREQGKQVDYLKTNEDDDTWWRWGDFTYKDANEFIEENSSSSGNNGKMLLDYFRAINDGGEYDNKQKRAILKSIIDKQKQKDLTAAVNGYSTEKLKVPKIGEIVGGYRYKGGDVNDQNSWEKI